MKRLTLIVSVFAIAITAAVILSPTPGAYRPPESARTPDGAAPARAPLTSTLTPSSIRIDTAGLHLIESFEGYSRCAYWDSYGGVWTAGFGQTRGVYGGFCFADRAAAEANLRGSVESEYQWAVRALGVTGQHHVDALDSFAYNLGAGIFTGQLRSDLEHGAYYAASRIMLQYDHAGGVVLAGLRTRRELEVRVLLSEPHARLTKAQRAALERQIVLLRIDLNEHGCRTAPHGRGRYHRLCAYWAAQGRDDHRRLT